jgi:beta-xylosidase
MYSESRRFIGERVVPQKWTLHLTIVLVSSVLLLAGASVMSAADDRQFRNPVLPGADPDVLVVGDTVWIYPTWNPGGGRQFYAFSSTNLTAWQRHGPVLDFKDVAWIDDDGRHNHRAWAPGVLRHGDQYYFYYAVGPQQDTASRIGVAVGDNPAGPFKDSGHPLLTGGQGFEAIDPMAFADPKTGKYYFYAGGSAGAKLRVFELNADLVSFAREVAVETPPNFTEGVYMHYRDGRYYLSYSHGSFQRSSYSVHYATAETPVGPWEYHGAILTSDATHKGPGHHSFAQLPNSREWVIVYHRWDHQTGDGPYRGSRQICIDRLEYDSDGLIKPVQMTDASGPPASPTRTIVAPGR